MTYTCAHCGKDHEEWPSFTFKAPDNYAALSETAKKSLGEKNDDFCIIRHKEQTDRFIRVTMIQKVVDHCEDLDYGVWVSLSEKSFLDYSENFNNEDHLTEYFGWLSNDIMEYDFDKDIPMNVYTQPGNRRPEVVPHRDFDHPFVQDYYNGITKAEADQRIHSMMTAVGGKNNAPPPERKKRWWKLLR